jgi:hypothetical protein
VGGLDIGNRRRSVLRSATVGTTVVKRLQKEFIGLGGDGVKGLHLGSDSAMKL